MVETVAGWLISAGIKASIATGIAQIGMSVLLSSVARAIAGKPSMGDQSRELEVTRSLPLYRTAYGEARIVGSWAPGWVVNDGILYACIILNSRPSDSVSKIEFDNRELTLTGDLLDFATGATATNAPFADHVTAWVGLGGQAAPPALIMSEWGDAGSLDDAKFWPADAWQGRTVLWLRLKKGSNKSASERWPQGRPQVHVTGKWSKVWHPTDGAQDPDDPATWEWSDNQGLCMLDALRTNPIAKLPTSLIHMTSINRQVVVADQAVARKTGGTEPRYRVGGVVVWNPQSELYQLLKPLEAAGGGGLVQIGGMIGYQPGEYLAPSADITDVLDEAPVSFTALSRGRDMPRAIRAIYPEPNAAWEDATLTPIEVPGGGGWDGGDDRVEDLELSLVPYPAQANRLAQIEARMRGQQKRIGGILFPRHLDLVAGANITMDLPRATDPRNGVYRITRIHPAHFLDAGDGVAFRLPFEASGISASVYAWNELTDEQDYIQPVSLDTSYGLDPPGAIATTSGADVVLESWGGVRPRVRFDFDPSPSSGVVNYEWQWRPTGGDWTDGGLIDGEVADGADKVFSYLDQVSDTETYEIRVRAIAPGKYSAWVTETAIVVTTGIPRWRADFEDEIYELERTPVYDLGTIFGLTRASTATYIDSSGVLQTAAADVARLDYSTGVRCLLVEVARANFYLHSQDITQAAWERTNCTVSADAIAAPDGTTTADKLVENAGSGGKWMQQSTAFVAGQPYSLSFFAKAGERTAVAVNARTAVFGATLRAVSFDLTSGDVDILHAGITADMVGLAGGWWWCWATCTAQTTITTSDSWLVRLSNAHGTAFPSYTGDGSSGLYLWGLQCEQGGPSSYIPTTTAAANRAADAPEMRGVTATLDLAVTYGDGTTATLADQAVSPGVWPTLTQSRIRRIVGTP